MKWFVTGADRETGEDRKTLFFGNSRGEAIAEAGKLGILVSSVEPAAVPQPVAYGRKCAPQEPYGEVRTSATWLFIVGLLIVCIGYVSLLAGVICLALGAGWYDSRRLEAVGLFSSGAAACFSGLLLRAAGELLRMISHIGTMMRDDLMRLSSPRF